MKKAIAQHGQTTIIEDTLSDGSIVYDVRVGNVDFHAANYTEADTIFRKLSVISKTVFTDEGGY